MPLAIHQRTRPGHARAILPRDLVSALCLLTWLAIRPSPALAQERIESLLLPDLDLVEPAMPASLDGRDYDHSDGRPRDTDDPPRLLLDLGASAASAPGLPYRPALGHARLRWGAQLRRTHWLTMRSELGVEDSGPDAARVWGRHELRGQIGTPAEKRGMGLDTAVHARLHHLGDTRRALAPVSLGPGSLVDAEIVITNITRIAQKPFRPDATSFAFPMGAGVRRTDYLAGDAVMGRADTITMHMAMGARMIDRHALHAFVEILGLGYTHTERLARPSPWYDPRRLRLANPGQPDGQGITEQYDLRMAGLEMLVYEDDIAITATGHTGWTWFRGDDDRRKANLFTMQYAFHIRGEGIGMGLGFGRVATTTADGGRFLAEYRLELLAEWLREAHGGKVRIATGWLADQEHEDFAEDPGILGRFAYHSEVFRRLTPGVQLGVYNLATYEPSPRPGTWDPWALPRGWGVEMGGFLRWSVEK